MEAINSFNKIFLEVWNLGVLGVNASEIIIGILIFLIFYILRRLFAKFIINKLNKLVNRTSTTIDNTVVNVIEGPLKFLPIVIGFFIASSYVTLSIELQSSVGILELWGIKVGPVIAGLGLFGVAVALGAQDLFKNLISGIMILMEKRFTIGDVISVSGEVEGVVEQIGFRSTLVRKFLSFRIFSLSFPAK